jgi:predicted O-methyltransferase YrrM
VDVYVEVAAEWLQEVFPGRVTFLKGDSLTEIPRFVASYQGGSIDLVHVDGDKRTYLQDVQNLWSRLAPDARVIFDDTDYPCAVRWFRPCSIPVTQSWTRNSLTLVTRSISTAS